MNFRTRAQLSGMMFLEYFVWGAWYVTLGTYLNTTLQFDGTQIGLAYSAFAIAAMVSPIFVGMIADKYFPTEKVLGSLHLLGGLILYFLSTITDFTLFFPVILLYTLCFMPTIALTNSLSFRQLPNPDKEFPGIRVLGTIGWIVIGQSMPLFGVEEASNIPILIASVSSFVLGLYSFTLPNTPPIARDKKTSIKELLGLEALSLMKSRSFAVLIISSMLICIPLSFYYAWANPFLNDIGMVNVVGKMTMGQMSEILFLLLMPFFFKRLGYKKMLIIGMAAWSLRYVLFMMGNPSELVWMLYGGIILHGICYDFFFVTGQIYVDERAPKNIKNAAQGLITFATYGVGMFIGSLLSGVIAENYTIDQSTYLWDKIWLVPAVLSALVLVLFAVFFREKRAKRSADEIRTETSQAISESKPA
ncbi:MAG: nucleoside permease [Bacteroidota bacterium]